MAFPGCPALLTFTLAICLACTGSISQSTPPSPTLMFSVTPTTLNVTFSITPGPYIITSYCVALQRANISGVPYLNNPVTRCSNTSTVPFTGLEEDGGYVVSGYVVNGNGVIGTVSKQQVAYTLAAAPSVAPANVRQDGGTTTAILLRWNGVGIETANGHLLAYQINYTPSVSGQSMIVNTASPATAYALTGLTSFTAYNITVAVVSTGGVGPPSSTIVARTDQDSVCATGFWCSTCTCRCDCNGQSCDQYTGVCACTRCFSGPACNITATDAGRRCVQDFFNSRTTQQLSNLQTEIRRIPRQLSQTEVELIMSAFADTSVNNVRSPRYDVLARPGGGELAQIRCVLGDSAARQAVTGRIKAGTLAATVITNDATNEVILNKPNFA